MNEINLRTAVNSDKITTACGLIRKVLIERLKSNIDIINNID